MEIVRTTVAGLAVTTVVVGTAITGCSKDDNGSSSSSSSSSSAASTSSAASSASSSASASPSAQPNDYSSLLIQPGDISPDFTAPQPPAQNPNGQPGVAQLFQSADGKDKIGDTILIVADAPTAAQGLDNTKTNYAGKVSGTWQPANVGSNGAMIAGMSPDSSMTITVVLFTEGKALVNMEFDGPPNDQVDPGFAVALANKQDSVIKSGLPS